MRRLLLAGAAIAALGVGWAIAQNVTQQTLSGAETWQAALGVPGGSGVFVNTKTMRGAKTYSLIGAATTVTTPISQNTDIVIITGAITTLNLSLPTSPFDQQTFSISCPGGTVNSLVLSGPTATTSFVFSPTSNFAACISTSIGASPSATWILSAGAGAAAQGGTPLAPVASGTWFRIQ